MDRAWKGLKFILITIVVALIIAGLSRLVAPYKNFYHHFGRLDTGESILYLVFLIVFQFFVFFLLNYSGSTDVFYCPSGLYAHSSLHMPSIRSIPDEVLFPETENFEYHSRRVIEKYTEEILLPAQQYFDLQKAHNANDNHAPIFIISTLLSFVFFTNANAFVLHNLTSNEFLSVFLSILFFAAIVFVTYKIDDMLQLGPNLFSLNQEDISNLMERGYGKNLVEEFGLSTEVAQEIIVILEHRKHILSYGKTLRRRYVTTKILGVCCLIATIPILNILFY